MNTYSNVLHAITKIINATNNFFFNYLFYKNSDTYFDISEGMQ